MKFWVKSKPEKEIEAEGVENFGGKFSFLEVLNINSIIIGVPWNQFCSIYVNRNF